MRDYSANTCQDEGLIHSIPPQKEVFAVYQLEHCKHRTVYSLQVAFPLQYFTVECKSRKISSQDSKVKKKQKKNSVA
jgi:hypothetical protein